MRTSRPSSWALSIRDLRSSGVPQRLLGAKKFVTWYLQHMKENFQVYLSNVLLIFKSNQFTKKTPILEEAVYPYSVLW